MPQSPVVGGIHGKLRRIVQRLLEIQSGGRQRSPKLIAEDERLMDALRKKTLTAKSIPSLEFNPGLRQAFRD